MNYTYPLIAVGGLVLGAFLGYLRGKRPTKVDLTVRFEDSKGEPPEGDDS